MNSERVEMSRRYSHIGMSSHSNSTYTIQYLNAFRVLYDSKEPVDVIALPMLYCLRHYLELALKENIKYFSEFSGSKSMVNRLAKNAQYKRVSRFIFRALGVGEKKG